MFRKKLDQFDIRDTILEVISIQKRQAEAKDINLESEFIGFSETW